MLKSMNDNATAVPQIHQVRGAFRKIAYNAMRSTEIPIRLTSNAFACSPNHAPNVCVAIPY
jgi:hypothetical protein